MSSLVNHAVDLSEFCIKHLLKYLEGTMATEQVKDAKLQEKIVAEFQQLRNEQRNLVNNLNTLEMDLKEHK